jgi:hypothetical protein
VDTLRLHHDQGHRQGPARTATSRLKAADGSLRGGASIKRKHLTGIETRAEAGQADFGAHFSLAMSEYLQTFHETLLDEVVE